MVKRKHSVQILSLFWGNFYPTEIPDLIFQLDDESIAIVQDALKSVENFEKHYKDLAASTSNSNFEKNYQKLCRHKSLIDLSIQKRCGRDEQVYQNDWLWIKGQKDTKDTCDIQTAVREFLEESGLKEFPTCEILSQEIVVTNKFKNREYVDTFWIAIFEEEFDVIVPEDTEIEVSERKWFTTEEALQNIQSSHIQTIEIACEYIQKNY
jgi:8-oxo-dGTP pyrophosphatase MutT (NUDIX family)